MTSRVPNNRKPVITPQKPSYAGARGLTRRELFDHIQGFQHVAPVTSDTPTTGTNTTTVTAGSSSSTAAPSSGADLSNFTPSALSVGDAGTPGIGTQAARYDHEHPMPGVFGPAGASHAVGFAPDPGSTAHTVPYYLGDDAAYHQLLATILTHTVTTKTTTYAVLSTDEYVLADATGGAFTVTLPTPVGITGRGYTIKRLNSGANAVTLATAAGLIDGAATQSLAAQYAVIRVVSDGANWYTV